ncbi:hypothetical protein PkP19E3_12085 [Pseudomonas koreensis]|nr:hypothetical protein PkP19E3_12085 [Pseudomonas koreensis]
MFVSAAIRARWETRGFSFSSVRVFRMAYGLPQIPCRSCRRLRSFDLDCDFKKQDQKIAAFGSSYRGRGHRSK